MAVRTLGKYFKNTTINGNAITIATLIAPEDNLHGIILRSKIGGLDPTYGKKAPPQGNRFDNSLIQIPSAMLVYNDVLIPAGNGLFMNTSADYVINIAMSWDVLNSDGTVA
ncbi:3-methyladenine DNA glycosylase [Pseudomonas yamanorum]|uniref:3-methyladenine DNA glycosylase n=1 Tax=Pseudomonas yamanorum TaxID=515393 RepID=UPI0015A09AD1|nr:3-methyladenine DNA glycosylase [Pseudomonas yamanorum]NVZ91343.1 3-methyladenine DNA glycosylase [Pseudomonas yamanorum]